MSSIHDVIVYSKTMTLCDICDILLGMYTGYLSRLGNTATRSLNLGGVINIIV